MPEQVNQRRYEALRAFFVDGLSHAEAGQRFGYTRWTMVDLVRQHRAGKLAVFAAPRPSGPPPGTAPAKYRVRGRVIELRREGLSTYEISARLAADGTPLNRTSVGEILSEEGFGRLLRHPAEQASTAAATAGRDTQLPRTAALDFATWPQRCDSAKAGLLLLIPDLVALDLPALVKQAGYPAPGRAGYRLAVVAAGAQTHPDPARLPRRRPAAHRPRRGAAGRAGHPTQEERPHRLLLPHQPRPPARLPRRPRREDDRRRAGHRRPGDLRPGLPRGHALGRRSRPGKALRTHPLTARPLRADLLRPGLRHPQPGLRQRRPDQSQPKPRGHRLLRPLEASQRPRPAPAGDGPEGHHPAGARRTRPTRDPLPHPTDALRRAAAPDQQPQARRLQDDHPEPLRPPRPTRVHESTVRLSNYPATVRRL